MMRSTSGNDERSVRADGAPGDTGWVCIAVSTLLFYSRLARCRDSATDGCLAGSERLSKVKLHGKPYPRLGSVDSGRISGQLEAIQVDAQQEGIATWHHLHKLFQCKFAVYFQMKLSAASVD